MHYNVFRDYDPGIGRYVQSDPIGVDGGVNTYSYVGGNPLTGFDPLGLANANPANQFNGSFFGGGGGQLFANIELPGDVPEAVEAWEEP